ncbi:hypothetical protein ACVIGB_000771 [Bradyrhizobium sp. USDA 4341]
MTLARLSVHRIAQPTLIRTSISPRLQHPPITLIGRVFPHARGLSRFWGRKMRADMAKVIVERPRRHDGCCRKGRLVDLDDLPSRIGMRRDRREHGGWKELNENLAPLRRFLHKQVGRRWNDVYSEIAANLRVDSTVQQHVRDHVEDFVDIHGQEERWITVFRAGGVSERVRVAPWKELYVDPADGILKHDDQKRNRRAERRRRERERPVTTIKLGDLRELKLIEGVWFEVEYAPLPAPQYREYPDIRAIRARPWDPKSPVVEHEIVVRRLISAPVFDVIEREHLSVGPLVDDEVGRRRWAREAPKRYAVSKRQISTKLLRRHGLVNAAAS